MTNTLTISRELAEKLALPVVDGEKLLPKRFQARAELASVIAAPVVERQEPVVIDLDAVDWETIQQAADESNWMPNEYMRNEWVADVCNFLKYGRADTSPPAPVEVVLPDHEFRETVNRLRAISEMYGHTDQLRERISMELRACLDKVKELNK